MKKKLSDFSLESISRETILKKNFAGQFPVREISLRNYLPRKSDFNNEIVLRGPFKFARYLLTNEA